jgi:hypothetical protein
VASLRLASAAFSAAEKSRIETVYAVSIKKKRIDGLD